MSRCLIARPILYRTFFLLVIGWITVAEPVGFAQQNIPPIAKQNQSAKRPEFDVVSVKQNKTGAPVIIDHSTESSNRFAVENMPLKMLISIVYGIREDLISGGPGWTSTDRYDVEAKVLDTDVPGSQGSGRSLRNQMVQSLLADRFKLVVHTETKEMPVFELSVAKSGLKLQASQPDTHESFGIGSGDLTSEGMLIPTFANLLSEQLSRTIIDKTGLTGRYDIKLKWAADMSSAGDSSLEPLPSLFTALQDELGLKLQSAKGPVKILVIDHVERPSEN
jgi:bla regulator protein BlaR1